MLAKNDESGVNDTMNKKIRVMHVAECVGGVDRYLHCLVKYMDRDNFENIMVLSQRYKPKEYEGLADDVEVLNINHGIGPKTLFSAINIRKLIKKYNPDVVYAHSSIAGAITRLANIGLKSRCIYNPHGWSFNMQGKKQIVFLVLEKLMAPFCNAIVCISDAEKQSALDKKICKEDKLDVIFNGIDIEDYKESKVSRDELNIPKDAFVVGMVGRICTQKAPDIFIKMASEIKSDIKNAYFIIVGDVIEGATEERKTIEKLAKDLGVNVLITGWVNNPLDYINTFDVACLLSRWEGFGLAIPEYMICNKPIVASRVDAIPNIIRNRENGMLIEVDDFKAAARAVLEIKEDDKLRNNLVKQGNVDVHKRFDVKRVAKETENLIIKLLVEK